MKLSGPAELAGILVLALLVPFGIRAVNAAAGQPPQRLPYLPAFEGAREQPFAGGRIEELRRLNPAYVVIGDSMAGTRIDERLLGELTGEITAPLLQAASGPVFWHLALKNWVIASGIRPRVVFIFFRDTNLTDPLFRLDDRNRWSLDFVAAEREDEVNAIVMSRLQGPWHRVHAAAEKLYSAERARRWMEPALIAWPARAVSPFRRQRARLLDQLNARFGLDRLRRMEAADIGADAGADFADEVNDSVLPLMLRDASRAGLTLCFVRVQRRPAGGRPPVQTAALQTYVADLRRHVEARGHLFHDETGDPELTLDMYDDGDHITPGARARYTRHFHERLGALFTPGR